MTKRLITSALPYVNNAPHLGNIIGCVLSGDVFARFCRLKGYETLYVCGTDGYGTATETKARAEGLSPREICEKYHVIHDSVYKYFNISFDAFGKTFTDTHTEVVQEMYKALDEAGSLIEQVSEQTYCRNHSFLADRLVEGNCPHCGSDQARGDQCDNCGKLLNPTELINPKCVQCGETPERRETKHLYLNLPKLTPELEAWQNKEMEEGQWTDNSIATTRSWMKQGLNPRPITRDLKWGVPVPRAGYEDKVFYVWFDAPIGYISITKAFFPETWKQWWLEPQNVKLYQFLGKDNIPFHSIIFPGCQLGSKKNWTMVHHMNSTEFLNYENKKFSKSRGVGIFGPDVMSLEYPVDFWRFYLLSVRPEKQDSNFLWVDFFDKINNELNDNIGNLINRVLVYYKKNFSEPLKSYKYDYPSHHAFIKEVHELTGEVTKNLEAAEIRTAVKNILLIGNAANRFFHEQELWAKMKENPAYVEETSTLLIHVIRNLGIMLSPFIPESAQKILDIVGVKNVKWDDINSFTNMAGITVNQPQLIFQKIDTSKIESLKARFGGEVSSFEKLDIRVGKILSVEPHATADHLFVEKIDIGSKVITVASALRKTHTEADLLNKHVLLVVNLEPAEFKGVISEGMVLVGSQGKKTELLNNDAWPVGLRLYRKDFKQEEAKTIKFDDFLEAKMELLDHQLTFSGSAIYVGETPVKSTQLPKGKVK